MAKKNIVIDEKKVEIRKTIELKDEQWSKLHEKALQNLVKNLKIDGFRKGKVPADIAKKYISKPQAFENALNSYLSTNLKDIFEELKKENDRVIATQPNINVIEITDEKVVFEVAYPLDVDLSKIKLDGVKVKFELPKVTEKDVEEYIDEKLKETSLQTPLKATQKTKFGDTVTLNYKGFVNNEPFDGGQAEGFELKLGSKTFIDTFEDQLVDKKVGYKGEVVVTFPEKYPVDKLAGQKATFEVEIVAAKRPEETKLTEDNIFVLRAGQAKTIEEAKDVIKWVITNNEIEISLNKYIEEFANEVLKNNEININEIFVHHQVEEKRKQVIQQLKQQGIKFEDYLKILDKNEKEFNELVFKEEKQSISFTLVAQHLLKSVVESKEVSKEEIEQWAAITSMSSGLPTSFLTGFFMQDENNKRQITERILEKRAFVAFVKSQDEKSGEKLEKLQKELETNATRISIEWNKRAEELKLEKEKEIEKAAKKKDKK
ncbi:trigger factor [Mycoplasmopsis bovigenitalium]|uniref:trigger factor n=1 Tax=Mycoplasmopsis bovigenitalium TaxID=2112 RepID=UPI00090C959C|nr:trigger factor [Mycoplasmopsis bovigenitalium]BAW18325.1 trigger factor [Mycoplasmopsis bovigenitalium]